MNRRIHIPLSFKLFLFVFATITVTVCVNSWQSIDFFNQQMRQSMRERLLQSSLHAATNMQAVIDSTVGQTAITAGILSQIDDEMHAKALASLVDTNSQYVAGFTFLTRADQVLTKTGSYLRDDIDKRLLEGSSLAQLQKRLKKSVATMDDWILQHKDKVGLKNLTPQTGHPLAAFVVPFRVGDDEQARLWVVLITWQTRIFGSLPDSQETSFIVDTDGTIITSSKKSLLKEKKAGEYLQIFDFSRSRGVTSGLHGWEDDGLGSFHKIPEYNLTALVVTNNHALTAAIYTVIKRSTLWACLLVLIAIVLSVIAARTLTQNLKNLQATAQTIAAGNFGTTANITSRDEVGLLADSINQMSRMILGHITEKVEMTRIEQEVATAQLVQQAYIPKADAINDRIRLTAVNAMASECGGDWWGFYKISDRYRLFCISDATGHGMSAALVTAMGCTGTQILSDILKQYPSIDPNYVVAMLAHFNNALYQSGRGRLTMTYLAALIDVEDNKIHYASAGHNPPFLIPKSGQDERLTRGRRAMPLRNPGMPLGIRENVEVELRTVEMKPGDRLIMYTDGIYEVHNRDGAEWGKRKFRDTLSEFGDHPIEDIKEAIISSLSNHLQGHPIDDDVTLVILEIPENRESVSLGFPTQEAS